MSSTAKYSRLETVWAVFQEHLLPRGLLRHRGERVDLSAIERTAILTVEAELDDMGAPGQTTAVHDLLPHLADELRGSTRVARFPSCCAGRSLRATRIVGSATDTSRAHEGPASAAVFRVSR